MALRAQCGFLVLGVMGGVGLARGDWTGYAGNAQHTALSTVAGQNLDVIKWQTAVDLNPHYSGNDLLIHYGSPVIDAANTVIVPVKTGTTPQFEMKAFNGNTGALMWTQTTNYALAGTGYDWTPSYSPTLSDGRLYYAGAGTVSWIGNLDGGSPTTPTTIAIGAPGDTNVTINTPLTADGNGNIYFGYLATNGGQPAGGLARIDAAGNVTRLLASSIAGANLKQIVDNSAPAIAPGPNGSIYVAMNGVGPTGYGASTTGQLVKVDFTGGSLVVSAHQVLMDPQTNTPALLPNDGTASPMIEPDNGDVYMGVLDNNQTSRGWMDHFSADLSVTKPTGGFGWDDTASLVPASMVPGYTGSSTYLLMTKYNNYVETGGGGQNMIAILDPNAMVADTSRNNGTGVPIMQVVESKLGPTPDPDGGFTEWCINSAVVDPATDSVFVGSEDGKLYRWDLASNTFTQVITLTAGIGEAYTPTMIGPDGTVYAINNATLFAIGDPTPEPGTGLLLMGGMGAGIWRRRR